MIRLAFLSSLVLAGGATMASAATANFTYTVKNIQTGASVGLTQVLSPTPTNEVAPQITLSGGSTRMMLTTSYSWYCEAQTKILPTFAANTQACSWATNADTRQLGGAFTPSGSMPSTTPWRRNYFGVTGLQLVPDSVNGQQLLAFVHGENKNEQIGGQVYQNQINTDVDANVCWSGIHGGAYTDCFSAYNGFVSSAHAPYVATKGAGDPAFIDDGPIIWPSGAYLLPDGSKATSGVTVPRSIVKDGYVYIFYQDGGTFFDGTTVGRQPGTRVARAPIPATGPITGFVVAFNGVFDTETSLPPGFTKATASSFYQTKGGRGDIILPRSQFTTLFSAAHLTGTSQYLGIQEHCDPIPTLYCAVQLWLSEDLVHWAGPVIVNETKTADYASFLFHYPIGLNSTGDNTTEIDPANFWVMGASGGHPTLINLSLKIGPNLANQCVTP